MEFRCRFSCVSDIEMIVELVRKGFRPNVCERLIYSAFGIETYIENQLIENASDTCYITIEMNNKVIGFVEYRYTLSGLVLNYIVIDEKYRGKGIASCLLSESISLLQPACSKIYLDVFDYNQVALQWYKSNGFKQTGVSYWYDLFFDEIPKIVDKIYTINSAQSKAMYDVYGFSSLSLFSRKQYNVGILGKNWIRITQKEILLDSSVLGFLVERFPERKFFALFPDEIQQDEFKNGRSVEFLKSYRMEHDLNKLK